MLFLESTHEALKTYEIITRVILKIFSLFFSLLLMKVTDNFVGQQREAAVVCSQPPATWMFYQVTVWAEVLKPEKAFSSALRGVGFVQNLIAHSSEEMAAV